VLVLGARSSGIGVQILSHLLRVWIRNEMKFRVFNTAYVSRYIRDNLVRSRSNKRVFEMRRTIIVAV
jgi:hypothetical protein